MKHNAESHKNEVHSLIINLLEKKVPQKRQLRSRITKRTFHVRKDPS
jgi:hypothetical protein